MAASLGDQMYILDWEDERFVNPRFLGAGTAWVCECHDRERRQPVAVKCMRISQYFPQEERFYNEIETLQLLQHRNIVRLIHTQWELRCVKLIMEKMDISLNKYIEEVGPLNSIVRKKFIYQILKGLSHCHSHGILHCNLNTSHVLIDRCNMNIKITGFSHCKRVPCPPFPAQRTIQNYNPPELSANLRKVQTQLVTTAADIWSLGHIFFAMVKGVDELGLVDIRQKLYELEYSPPIPEPDEGDLIEQMLRVEPHQRISVADALQHSYFNTIRQLY